MTLAAARAGMLMRGTLDRGFTILGDNGNVVWELKQAVGGLEALKYRFYLIEPAVRPLTTFPSISANRMMTGKVAITDPANRWLQST